MLQNWKIKTKFLVAIALLALISFSGLLYVSAKFREANQAYTGFLQHESEAAMLGARAAAGIWTSTTWMARLMTIDPGSQAFDNAAGLFASNYDGARARLVQVPELVPSRKDAIAELLAGSDEVRKIGDQIVQARKSGDEALAQSLIDKVDGLMGALSPKFGANNTALTDMLSKGGRELSASVSSTILNSMIGLVVGIAAALAFALVVATKGITAPMARLRQRMVSLAEGETAEEINGVDRRDEIGDMAGAVAIFRANALEARRLEQEAEANRNMSESERADREAQKARESAELQKAVDALGGALQRLSDGDLACHIDTPFVAHLETLRADFNNSVVKLNQAMQAVGLNARAISGGAEEVRSSADDLARRTEQQAASVEETAAALEEITTTVRDAARRASEASDLVARTRTGAEKSGEIVRQAVDAMQQIERSSSEISNIIGVIDDIAFQTNLLALNAGVEAARAGEAGKGFAVVAQEVRELAQRSAKAAKEIKDLITTSGQQVKSGVTLVGETGEALEVIVNEVQEINRHVHAIAEATREQSIGLQEINTAVNTMDQGTQQNAAMVEESNAASHSLASEARALAKLLEQFKLGGAQLATASAPVVASQHSRPAASPARQLGNRLAKAFGGGGAAAAVKHEPEWSEF
jgi:methyl-accepting chemotaxis protein